jgi:murein DD-endopeptidase MepM/ murein hydrolase activator NlpD
MPRPLLALALLSVTAFVAAAGCSSYPAADPAPPKAIASTPADQAGDDADGDDSGDLGAPNDDPALGGEPVDPDGGAGDGGGGAPTAGNDCTPGGLYCGGDKVTGDAKTLYKCTGPGTPLVSEKCALGCTVNPGTDDSCVSAPGARVAAPVPGKVVTYPFGVKNSSYAAGYHTGDDYATPTGSNAVAVRGGTIRWSNDNGGAYGKWLGLDADNGRTYVYCHLSNRLVTAGTKVVAGQLLAKTGATGNVTGPHLHFEDHPLGPFVYGKVRKPLW